jgi:hypothetical protein
MKLPISPIAERETERMLMETMVRNKFLTIGIRQRRKNIGIQKSGKSFDILLCPVYTIYKAVTA